jgi:hypothetical protein
MVLPQRACVPLAALNFLVVCSMLLIRRQIPVHVWRSRTLDVVRCASFPCDITTIMDQKQGLNALNSFQLNMCVKTPYSRTENCLYHLYGLMVFLPLVVYRQRHSLM